MATPLNLLRLIVFILIMTVDCRLSTVDCYAAVDKYVRVAIVQDLECLRFSVNGSYSILDARDKKILSSGKFITAAASGNKTGIVIDGVEYRTDRLFIQVADPEAIVINGRKYRGNIRLVKKENLHLLVVNDIELEDYVKGILYHEVSHYWPEEALKAQAVVCRTYALYQMAENSSRDFDVTNDVYSQVYGGKTSERYRTNKAVEETKGIVLVYEGRVFPAYFHATCAGYTENASLLWNIDVPVLRGVACAFCKESPHFNWHQVTTLAELKDALAKAGYNLSGDIRAIETLGRDRSGRVRELKIKTSKNDLTLSAKDFRNSLGPNIIRSTNFEVNIAGSDAVFEGLGWGHGVGMCQWGAYFMAKEGRSYQDILAYYYPGSALSQD
jgi:stage II sporulation protein D